MLILTLRTDKPEAELGLYEDTTEIIYVTWQAHRQLAETIHSKLSELLQNQNKELKDIQGIVFYKGPGSFTGLRIGASVADTLAYSLSIPIVGVGGEAWRSTGMQKIVRGEDNKIVTLEYGAPVRITQQKK